MASICPVFKWHWNTEPFVIQPLLDHLNTKQVWYSDPRCNHNNELLRYSTGKLMSGW